MRVVNVKCGRALGLSVKALLNGVGAIDFYSIAPLLEAAPFYTSLKLTLTASGSGTFLYQAGDTSATPPTPDIYETRTYSYSALTTYARVAVQIDTSGKIQSPTGSDFFNYDRTKIPVGSFVMGLDRLNVRYFSSFGGPSGLGFGNPQKQLPIFIINPPAGVEITAYTWTRTDGTSGSVTANDTAVPGPSATPPTTIIYDTVRYDMTQGWTGGGIPRFIVGVTSIPSYNLSSLTATQWRDLRAITFSTSMTGPDSAGVTVTETSSWELG